MGRHMQTGVISTIEVFKFNKKNKIINLNKKDIDLVYIVLNSELDKNLFTITKEKHSVKAELKLDIFDQNIEALINEIAEIYPDIKDELFYDEDEEEQEERKDFQVISGQIFTNYSLLISEILCKNKYYLKTNCLAFTSEIDKYVDNEFFAVILLTTFARKMIKNILSSALLFFVE